jgi:hypothetical protein
MTTSRSSDDAREQTATDKRVLKVRELDQEDGTPGREIAFSDVGFSPLPNYGAPFFMDADLDRQ